jgi:hypothetical protein
MPLVRFIGDVHGRWRAYKRAIRNVPFSIQVGDMGVGFHSYRYGEVWPASNPPFDSMSKGRHLFIRGNHDNPDVCKRRKYWIPDGTMIENIFCLGGAVSLDRTFRTEGMDWWRDEELSAGELEVQVSRYAALKPEVVCTHECPDSVASEVMAAYRTGRIDDGSRTRKALEHMLQLHQPRLWVFGHWHTPISFARRQTAFRCLGELECIDVDV